MKKILIANRGEIAGRIVKTCSEMGIESIVVYSDADKELPYVQQATRAYHLGEPPVIKSYLNQDKIIEIAQSEKVDAIHPGYGFLSENGEFAKKIEELGITFIGPSPNVVEAMGDKVQARKTMEKAGVPVVPGTTEPIADVEEAASIAGKIGYPVMLKASAGGGGIGMVRCDDEETLRKQFLSSQQRAKMYFGSDRMFIEKFISPARHIEVQVFGDSQGNIIHLFERDCSIQRRHQKVIEESPSPYLTEKLRGEMGEAAVKAAQSVSYTNAGTVEFIVDGDGHFYFLEMNTRLQVEHPVTEMTTGLDLVRWQIEVASGKSLPLLQNEVQQKGHSMEFRLYAEDPVKFLPSPGKIEVLSFPQGEGIRIDAGYAATNTVSPFYDPMIAKIIVSDSNREQCLKKAAEFFNEFEVRGIKTNAPLFIKVLEDPDFQKGVYTTGFLSEKPKVTEQ
ncbi:acetyl/propionyl/methylcrotonyl-CoA carboxylase subunit alpha [Fictibacillus sp. KU28468]|uniref:acetyl-CoA carboxylase biotin carboxylase subunit n=1 Tax=Fictibacillus sp. KU28468 TaxID=2991053 RepID=UPI00223CB14D|nr:acetyl-CoA carboxylase biotin carboxylase subunit [Fictibacillus sp. KU28468]UZJ77266.1 acetyl-CoA carboxylase biotin carboxylase subunit [Fictibacillus sp. KU28468]